MHPKFETVEEKKKATFENWVIIPIPAINKNLVKFHPLLTATLGNILPHGPTNLQRIIEENIFILYFLPFSFFFFQRYIYKIYRHKYRRTWAFELSIHIAIVFIFPSHDRSILDKSIKSLLLLFIYLLSFFFFVYLHRRYRAINQSGYLQSGVHRLLYFFLINLIRFEKFITHEVWKITKFLTFI